MAYSDEEIIIFSKMCDYINQVDIFWLSDLKQHFGIKNSEERTRELLICLRLMNILRENHYLQCCENKGHNKQYILVKQIIFNDLNISKK